LDQGVHGGWQGEACPRQRAYATRQEIYALKRENGELKQLVADLSLEALRLKKTAMPMMEDGAGTSANTGQGPS
jgi:hypothetical protein